MRLRFLLVFVVIALVACATPAAPATQPPATIAPTTSPVSATIAPVPTQATASNPASCATTNAAPPDKFRSDDPKKLEASAKPKLVEFFAFW